MIQQQFQVRLYIFKSDISQNPMGNTQNGKNSKVVLNIKHQEIIIHHGYKMNLKISSLSMFPHGMDGLRLWEAGIILSRYVINNVNLFKNKRVLQLGAGVGIAGLTVKKWTQCTSIEMTDYNDSVIQNIQRNMEKNSLFCPAFHLDWKAYHQGKGAGSVYDVIIGSDIVYFGCPVQDLYKVFKEKLVEKGIGIIVIPVRKNYAELFTKLVEKQKFDLEIQQLDKQQYFQSPFQNSAQGQKTYPLLKQIKFEVYKLYRKAL